MNNPKYMETRCTNYVKIVDNYHLGYLFCQILLIDVLLLVFPNGKVVRMCKHWLCTVLLGRISMIYTKQNQTKILK